MYNAGKAGVCALKNRDVDVFSVLCTLLRFAEHPRPTGVVGVERQCDDVTLLDQTSLMQEVLVQSVEEAVLIHAVGRYWRRDSRDSDGFRDRYWRGIRTEWRWSEEDFRG